MNILLNYRLILGNLGMPSMGVEGAAYGTVISQAVGVAVLLWRIHGGAVPGVRMPVPFQRVDKGVARDIWRIGWPAAMDMVILNAGFVAVLGMVSWHDELAVAAHAVGLRVQTFAFVPGLAVARAAGAMIGNALGAQDPGQARALARLSMQSCGGLMTVLGLLLLVLARPILTVFDIPPNTPLADYTVEWITILGAGMPITGIWIALAGMLQGAGHTMSSLRINAFSTLAIQIPLCWVLGSLMGMGPFGVWLAFPIGFVFKAILGFIAYRAGAWAETSSLEGAPPMPQ